MPRTFNVYLYNLKKIEAWSFNVVSVFKFFLVIFFTLRNQLKVYRHAWCERIKMNKLSTSPISIVDLQTNIFSVKKTKIS